MNIVHKKLQRLCHQDYFLRLFKTNKLDICDFAWTCAFWVYLLSYEPNKISLLLLGPLNIFQVKSPHVIEKSVFESLASIEEDFVSNFDHAVASTCLGCIEQKELAKQALLHIQVVKVVAVLFLFGLCIFNGATMHEETNFKIAVCVKVLLLLVIIRLVFC